MRSLALVLLLVTPAFAAQVRMTGVLVSDTRGTAHIRLNGYGSFLGIMDSPFLIQGRAHCRPASRCPGSRGKFSGAVDGGKLTMTARLGKSVCALYGQFIALGCLAPCTGSFEGTYSCTGSSNDSGTFGLTPALLP